MAVLANPKYKILDTDEHAWGNRYFRIIYGVKTMICADWDSDEWSTKSRVMEWFCSPISFSPTTKRQTSSQAYKLEGRYRVDAYKNLQKMFFDDRQIDAAYDELEKLISPRYKELAMELKRRDQDFHAFNLAKFEECAELHRGMDMRDLNWIILTSTAKQTGVGLKRTSTSMSREIAMNYAENVVVSFEIDQDIRKNANVVRYSAAGTNPRTHQERYHKVHYVSLSHDREVRLLNSTRINKITKLLFKNVPKNRRKEIFERYKHVTENISFYNPKY